MVLKSPYFIRCPLYNDIVVCCHKMRTLICNRWNMRDSLDTEKTSYRKLYQFLEVKGPAAVNNNGMVLLPPSVLRNLLKLH